MKKRLSLSSFQLHSYFIVKRVGKTSKREEHTEKLRTATDTASVTTRSDEMIFAVFRFYIFVESMPHYNQLSASL